MPVYRHHISVGAASLLASALIAAACGGSSKTHSTSTPRVAETAAAGATKATPSPAPTAAPSDVKVGDRLRAEGEFRAAADVYAAVAAHSGGEKQRAALLAQAQMLSRAGDAASARIALDAYFAASPGESDAGIARYLLASTLDDLGDMQGALASYERYIAADGAAADFARIERAKLLARLGRPAEAASAAEAVLASGLLPEFKASFTLSMGKAFADGGDDPDALAWYTRAQTIEGGDVGSALARAGAIEKRLGDAAWVTAYTQAITAYPSSGAASQLLDELDAAAVPVSDYVRGVVDYRAFRNIDARAALVRAVAANDHVAEATYYIGALDERAGDAASAIASYQRSHDLDPASMLADDALWWRGRLLEQAGRFSDAAAAYGVLVSDLPVSKWRTDADFRRGLVQYKAQNYAGAALVWSLVASGTRGDDAFRARFWQGRALRASHDPLADAVLTQLAADLEARGTFYALRAEVLLGKNATKEKSPKLNRAGFEQLDWDKIASYIKGITGIDPRPAVAKVAADTRSAMGAALEDVGLHAQSDAVFRSIIRDNRDDPTALYQLTFNFSAEGRTPLAARAAVTLLGALPPDAPLTPDDLLRVAYPAAYGDLAVDAATQADISPLLLLALVRQESFFDAEAGSAAGALGLTQVVPATGQQIATTLGVNEFSATDLYRPKVSLRFGASYLASQLTEFGGDAYRALAAYNGGPGAAASAADTAGHDNDLFVEELEFDETRSYVRLVMANLARYRQLYAGIDRPSLPR